MSMLEFIKNLQFDESNGKTIDPPANKVMALNRISYGCTKEMIEQVNSTGLDAYIESQLHPSNDEGQKINDKINSTTLHIKYEAKDENYPALDEDRPLGLWNESMEKLWPLAD